MRFLLLALVSAVALLQVQGQGDCPPPTRGVLDPDTCYDCQCAIRPRSRERCEAVKQGNETFGEACRREGCCYEPTKKPRVPYCYQPRVEFKGPAKACENTNPENRTRAGWKGISKLDCTECMGGCFNQCLTSTVWCYQPPASSCETLDVAVVIVVDGSGSIDSSEYAHQRNFIREFVNSFSISPTMTQIGIVEFETGVDEVLDIESVNNVGDVIHFIDNTMQPCPHKFCRTNTAAAVLEMVDMIEHIDNKEKVAIILTDGISNVGNLTDALLSVPDDILMFSVGIDGAIASELLQIAMSGKNPAGAASRVTSVDNFDELSAVIDDLRDEVCLTLSN